MSPPPTTATGPLSARAARLLHLNEVGPVPLAAAWARSCALASMREAPMMKSVTSISIVKMHSTSPHITARGPLGSCSVPPA
eukprot:CAMPEP_0119089966 /NCGR_PEP_ID=MMETSP1178-20130426/150882_1 /TAXON_ID=33656 /ORGANISM="unid sp, Strain CCMP2000" /LENGTH=81 /DNA_ID=CAMNT_0007073351 /DNA_START=123 /DNA_END=366 /DNA_ORIENTATION=+